MNALSLMADLLFWTAAIAMGLLFVYTAAIIFRDMRGTTVDKILGVAVFFITFGMTAIFIGIFMKDALLYKFGGVVTAISGLIIAVTLVVDAYLKEARRKVEELEEADSDVKS